MKRREFVAAVGAAVCAPIANAAAAGSYPSRPIRWIVGFTVGGASDLLVRLVADGMQKDLGVPLVVENKPGASGNIAAMALKQSPADGYTILHGETSVLYTNEHMSKLSYDPVADLTYIGGIARAPFVLLVHPSFPARTLQEFIAYAKAHPGSINYGTPGNGSPQRISMEVFQRECGVQLTQVPYKGGAPALVDVRSGQIQAMMVELSVSLPYLRDGSLRGLAVSAPGRLAATPDLPTFTELGFGGVAAFALHGVVGPARLPPEIVQRLNRALDTAIRMPKVVEYFRTNGLQAALGTPQQFEATVRAERARVGEVVRTVGITLE